MSLVMVPGFISHVEYSWKEPSLARFLRKLSAFARVITFDKRGMGLSDRDPAETPSLEERMDDVAAVMDASEAARAILFAWSEGGPMSILFAATYPERVSGLILVGTTPRFSAAHDFPEGLPRDVLELAIEAWREEWGTGVALELYGPSVADDERVRSWWAAYQRFAASPGAVAASLQMHLDVDVRDALPRVKAPTLIIHRVDDMLVPVTCARHMAGRIPEAQYLELPGSDHMYWLGDQDETLSAIRSFLAADARRRPDRCAQAAPAASLDRLGESHGRGAGRGPTDRGGLYEPRRSPSGSTFRPGRCKRTWPTSSRSWVSHTAPRSRPRRHGGFSNDRLITSGGKRLAAEYPPSCRCCPNSLRASWTDGPSRTSL